MRKIGIITFHFVNNFGGALQSYALQKAISKECDIDTEILDYRNWFIRLTDKIRQFPITANLVELRSGLQTMSFRAGRVKKFDEFISSNCHISKRYRNGKEISLHSTKYDGYVCGSDQIWNPYLTFGVAKPYFLGFVKNNKKKISYAPSFGINHFNRFFKTQIKKHLLSFDAISVRENEGAELVLELTGKKPLRLIDPTFLLDKKEWEERAIEPKVSGKYMLLYIMQQDEKMYEYAKKLKEKYELKIIEISRYGYKPSFVDECIIYIGPREFLGLFKYAEYICTNSYHGFVFSIIFEKDFCLIPCKRFQTRINNLAEILSINMQKEYATDDIPDTCYDRENIRKTIIEEKMKAITYLKQNIVS